MKGEKEIKDLHVEVRIRNNQLLSRRTQHGLTQQELATAVGISVSSYRELETLRTSPFQNYTRPPHRHRRKPACSAVEWCSSALALARFYAVEPEVLFPEATHEITCSRAVRLVSGDELRQLLGSGLSEGTRQLAAPVTELFFRAERDRVIQQVLSTLSRRDAQIMRMLFGLDGEGEKTAAQVGRRFKLSRARILQIMHDVLYLLRKRDTARLLGPYVDLDLDED